MTDEPRDENSLAARRAMVENQLVARGIREPRVLAAFLAVPRECFVPHGVREHAYADRALPIGLGQTISQPYVVACMLEFLALTPSDRVLDVGTGSGYQAALLAQLAGRVDSVERLETLAKRARKNLARAGISGVDVHLADGSLGYPARAPYDAIIVGAGAPEVPEALLAQLAPEGRLVIPTGPRGNQTLQVVRRRGDRVETRAAFGCAFVPLQGEQAWAPAELESSP